MSTTPTTPNQPDELAVLRQTVAELTIKANQRKQRITELEQQLTDAQTATQTAQASLHEITVSRPMQTLAEAISPTPELFLTELERVGYKATASNGQLALTLNDRPVEGVEVTAGGLTKLLLDDSSPAHKNFAHLLTKSKASGGGAIGQTPGQFVTERTTQETPKPKFSGLGLR